MIKGKGGGGGEGLELEKNIKNLYCIYLLILWIYLLICINLLFCFIN